MNQHPEHTSASSNPAESKTNFWTDNKMLFKGFLVGIMIIIMMIPSAIVNNLVTERAQRQQEVIQEISSKWSGPQTLTSPFLFIPYSTINSLADGTQLVSTKYLYILPHELAIQGQLLPEHRKRSLYEVNLYRSHLQIRGKVTEPDIKGLNIAPENIHWDQARILMGVDDTRGLESSVLLQWNNQEIALTAGVPKNVLCRSGLQAPVDFQSSTALNFSLEIALRGSEQLYFSPIGKTSTVFIQSPWKDPAFDGAYLPQASTINDEGFTAQWKVLEEARTYPQIFTDIEAEVAASSFGVKLLQPTDSYTKTDRTVKYALLFIALTFTVFFLMELLQKRSIHPLQYILVGIALVIFYTLLLSISEYVGFNMAYFISAAATILLITLYVGSIFKKNKLAWGFGLGLTALYAYIFFLIQLQDYALLFGSIGLFVIIALIMYSSRKIDGYAKGKM